MTSTRMTSATLLTALVAATVCVASPAQAQIRRSAPAPDAVMPPPPAVPAPQAPMATPASASTATSAGGNGMVMSGRVESAPRSTEEQGGGLNLGWPPKLPPFFSLEVMAGSRMNQNVSTTYTTFQDTTYTVPVVNTGVTVPNIADPKIATQAGSGASMNSLKAEMSFLVFSGGLEAAGMRQNPGSFQAASVSSSLLAAPSPLLSQGYTGFYGKALGLRAGYRRETYRGVPGVDANKDVSLNEFLVGYGLGLGIGPISAGVDLLGGMAPLSVADGAATASTIVPAEGEAAVGLTLYGVKIKAGQRFRLTGYGSDFSGAFSSLLGSALPAGLNLTNALNGSAPAAIQADAVAKAKTIQDTFRATVESGPFIEAGVSF